MKKDNLSKELLHAAGIIIAFMVLLIGIFAIMSCDNKCEKLFTSDSTKIASIVEDQMSPFFVNEETFVAYASEEVKYSQFVDLVRTLHPETTLVIAKQAIKSAGYVDYKTFLNEYLCNEHIYHSVDAINFKKDLGKIPINSSSSTNNRSNIIPITEPGDTSLSFN